MFKQIIVHRTKNMPKCLAYAYVLLCTSIICIMAPINVANSNILADADGKDDSDTIVEHIRQSLNSAGLVSLEQHTGRLLYNPNIEKLQAMGLKQKILLPAMVVSQKKGLKLVAEMPLSCFMLSAQELSGEHYKGFRQYDTLQYIRDVKGMNVSRALICTPISKSSVKAWKGHLALDQDEDPFVFEEHSGDRGEKFYYFLNVDGSFEMYM